MISSYKLDLSDLVYEAVRNSLEAGAGKVRIEVDSADGILSFLIQDDGDGVLPDDPFGNGVSSKGKDRGEGLFLIKEASVAFSITRREGLTSLSFSIEKERKDFRAEDIYGVLVNMGLDVVMILKIEGKEKVRIDNSVCSSLDVRNGRDLSSLRRMVNERSREWLN